MRRTRGFTLIELLVVIAIIALLMAILMPALNRAREQARTIGCRSNFKQYGIGLRMYLDENQQKFPDAWKWLKSKSGNYAKKGEEPDGVFWSYLKALDVHLGPRFDAWAKGTNWQDTAVSYVMNSYVGAGSRLWTASREAGAGLRLMKSRSPMRLRFRRHQRLTSELLRPSVPWRVRPVLPPQ
jgi:prepilin-type N-terminal cleavage/methylation domain-containing protein